MPDLDGAPVAAIFGFFFTVVFLRTQATYWIARLVVEQTLRRGAPRTAALTRAQRWTQGPGAARGVAAINRWGTLAVPLSFLTVGFKTVVNAAAGLTRMSFARYLPAMLVGCLAHATIYATVGWAAWELALSAAAGSWVGALVLAGIVLAVVAGLLWRGRRRRAQALTAP